MHIQLIQVPYDSGYRDVRMGHGPEYFVEHGAAETLRAHNWMVDVESIEAQRPFHAENYTAFELVRQLAPRVRAAKEGGAFPLILSGNCNSSLGTLGGIDAQQVGIIWFDAHGDFNTPETTRGGFLDGMALATATGHCWTRMARGIPGFTAIPEERVLMVGVRQLDDGEQELLQHSPVTLIRGEQIRASGLRQNLEQALVTLRSRAQKIYLHIDLDVLDIQVGRANSYAEPNGLFIEEMEQAITMIAQQFEVAAVAFTAYDPSCDPEENILRAGLQLMEHVIREVEANIQNAS